MKKTQTPSVTVTLEIMKHTLQIKHAVKVLHVVFKLQDLLKEDTHSAAIIEEIYCNSRALITAPLRFKRTVWQL